MEKDLHNIEWKKNWDGKWSFLECCDFGREYTTLFQPMYGVGPQHALFTFERGKSANFLVAFEIEKFSQELIKRMHQNANLIEEWTKSIVTHADTVSHFVRSFDKKAIMKKDYDTLWAMLDLYLAAHFPIKKIVDYLTEDELQKALPILERARVYAEPVYSETMSFVKKFSETAAPGYSFSSEHFLCLTRGELNALHKSGTKPDDDVLSSRYEFSVLLVIEGVVSVFTGTEAKDIVSKTIHKAESDNILRGTSAFPGIVRGRVRVVTNPASVSSLDKDTVLVTGMTRPEYLHLFRESVAVVTDAGGILSHAAITARELKKPTVVGTETATKVLKDGDMIEVDAEKGIVRKLG